VIADAFALWQEVISRQVPMSTRTRRDSFARLVIAAIEGAYVRGRAERSNKAFLEAGDWLAGLARSEA
ncbi:MAG: hypothetical protein ACREU7_06330, partial [Burkholderiales bacterium]